MEKVFFCSERETFIYYGIQKSSIYIFIHLPRGELYITSVHITEQSMRKNRWKVLHIIWRCSCLNGPGSSMFRMETSTFACELGEKFSFNLWQRRSLEESNFLSFTKWKSVPALDHCIEWCQGTTFIFDQRAVSVFLYIHYVRTHKIY